MITRDTDKYLALVNKAYSMLGVANGYSGNIETGKEPTIGFMVAIRTLAEYDHLQDVMVGSISEKLKEVVEELAVKDLFIGSFRDVDNGKIYFEIAVNILDFDTAIEWGKKNGQKYIYDVTNDCNIPVNE